MALEFVGREAELRSLEAFLQKQEPSIGVVYGRHRVGKSVLIRKALEGRRALVFEGLENQPKREQIKAFLFELSRQTGRSLVPKTLGSWREALALLESVLRKAPACVVLDEFQWMANYRRDLVSDLKMIWEVEQRAQRLQQEFPSKTIQRVLVVHGEPSREVVQSGYFYRIIKAQELASAR